METALLVSIIGATVSIIVALTGAIFANRNNIILQSRKLKEEHYIGFFEALHYMMADNEKPTVQRYVLTRDKMFLIASENVIFKLLDYENKGAATPEHDLYLTELVKAIRHDLQLKDTNFPEIAFKKA